MVKGFSKVILMGNLTRDPETRTTPSGTTVVSFGIAVNRNYRNANGQDIEEVSFFDCSAWGRQGETIAKWCHRGSGILISGRLSQHSWEDEKTGQKRSRVEVTVEDFNFVGGGRSDGEGGGSYGGGSYNSGGNYGGSSYGGNRGGAKPADTGADVLPSDIELDKEPEIDLEGVPF